MKHRIVQMWYEELGVPRYVPECYKYGSWHYYPLAPNSNRAEFFLNYEECKEWLDRQIKIEAKAESIATEHVMWED